jgi:hypothetical protein
MRRYSSRPVLSKTLRSWCQRARRERRAWWTGAHQRTARSWPTGCPGAPPPRPSPPAGPAWPRAARSSSPGTTAPSGVPSTRARRPPIAPTTPPPGSADGPAAARPASRPRTVRRPPRRALPVPPPRRSPPEPRPRRSHPGGDTTVPPSRGRRRSLVAPGEPSLHCAHVEQNGVGDGASSHGNGGTDHRSIEWDR